MSELQEELDGVIKWYKSLNSDFLGINELMHKRQIFVANLSSFASELGDARKLYNITQFEYENHKMGLRAKYYKSTSATKAESMSRANSAKQYEEMKSCEAQYYSLYFMFQSYDKVLSSMNQHIAKLRDELNYNKVTSH